MNSINREGFVVRVCRLSLLAVMALGVAGVSQAQAQSGSAKSAPASTQASARAAQTALAKESAGKGQFEGIKVHGHWIIEVKNPDGKLVTHREFENSLDTPGGGGASLLSAFLGRSLTPGSWTVQLENVPSGFDVIWISEPSSYASTFCPENTENDVSSSCNPSLSVSAATYSSALSGTTVTLASTAPVTVPQFFASTIGYVETDNFVCLASVSPQACVNSSSPSYFPLTSRNLDGQNGDPPPVPVSAGQTVAVSVVISFQ